MADAYRVVITDYVADDLRPERDVLDGVACVEALDAHSEADLAGCVETADALITYHKIELTADTLSRLERCRVIVRGGVGYDNVDIDCAAQARIPVANVPDYGTEEVADSAIGLMLTLTRGIALAISRLRDREGPWNHLQVAPLWRLRGRVLGIVGLGRIGTAVALRAKALGMDVMFYDPYKPDGYDKALQVRRAESLEELLRQSFVVTIHCPLTQHTQHLIDRKAIDCLRQGAYLVNTARGGIVDTSAVADAIESGRLAGAGLDVLEHEPPDDTDRLVSVWRDPSHPAHHRVIINPHSAFYSEEGLLDLRTKAAATVRRVLMGQPCPNQVNRWTEGEMGAPSS